MKYVSGYSIIKLSLGSSSPTIRDVTRQRLFIFINGFDNSTWFSKCQLTDLLYNC